MIDLNTITPQELEELVLTLEHETYELDKLYIEADEDYNILEDTKKAYFAGIVELQPEKYIAEKERKALLTDQWTDFINELQIKRRKARQLRVERDHKLRLHDDCKTIIWSKNRERR